MCRSRSFKQLKPRVVDRAAYRIPPVELHTLGQARLAFRPSLHFLHDPLDVIPGDPVEKHGSRSWTQRTTACLCLAAHNFHITVPLPRSSQRIQSLGALRALREAGGNCSNSSSSSNTKPRRLRSPPRRQFGRQLEEKRGEKKSKEVHTEVVVVVELHRLFFPLFLIFPPGKKNQRIVQKMRPEKAVVEVARRKERKGTGKEEGMEGEVGSM